MILGHETVGRIELLGAGLKADWRGTPLAEGDRVTWASSIVCGECYYCRLKRQPTRCVGLIAMMRKTMPSEEPGKSQHARVFRYCGADFQRK